jgi:hypothetical protein
MTQSESFLASGLKQLAEAIVDVQRPKTATNVRQISARGTYQSSTVGSRSADYDAETVAPYSAASVKHADLRGYDDDKWMADSAPMKSSFLLGSKRPDHYKVQVTHQKLGKSFKTGADGVAPLLPVIAVSGSATTGVSAGAASEEKEPRGGQWSVSYGSATSELNHDFINRNKDGRRPIRTSSTAASSAADAMAALPHFVLKPSKLDFGSIAINQSLNLTFSLLNDSTVPGRFHISWPLARKPVDSKNSSNGFAIVAVQHEPSFLSGGLSRQVTVTLTGQRAGEFIDEIVVKTEKRIFRLPIVAVIVESLRH